MTCGHCCREDFVLDLFGDPVTASAMAGGVETWPDGIRSAE